MVRWGIKRYSYTVSPGLYKAGNPDAGSEVLVTANYKLTFDKLRKELTGLNLWILVIDTKGINVWCAAGKGTFGTEEIIKKIMQTSLKERVKHRRIILPQLGAPGVAAHMITKITGFRVIFGPVRASDIREFLQNKYQATVEMRRVRFDFIDRLVLTPIEIVHCLKFVPIIFILLLLLNIIGKNSNMDSLFRMSVYNLIPYIYALFVSSFVFPLMLPIIPGRAFALKGALLGLILSGIFIGFHQAYLYPSDIMILIGNSMILTCICSFLGLNFTGCTTYTSFSGTQKETLWGVPVMILLSLVGIGLIVASKFIS